MKNETKMDKATSKILLLYLLKQLKTVCQNTGITYYAYAGTLLGAIRHQGIIPWDDDIDVIIERKDYNAFLEGCKLYLNSPVTIRTRENDPTFCDEYIKICFQDDILGYSDISVDVFVVDLTNPSKKILRAIQNQVITWLYPIKKYKLSKDNKGISYIPRNKFKRLFLSVSSILSYNFIEKLHKSCMTFEKKDTGYFVNWGSHYSYKKVTFQRSDWGVPQEIPFENTTIAAPCHIERTLIPIYGKNYMTPPPVEKRIDHGIRQLTCAKLDFDAIKREVLNEEI